MHTEHKIRDSLITKNNLCFQTTGLMQFEDIGTMEMLKDAKMNIYLNMFKKRSLLINLQRPHTVYVV